MRQSTFPSVAARATSPDRWLRGDVGSGVVLGLLVLALVVARHVGASRGLSPATAEAAILVCFTVASWALGLFKEPITTLLLFLLGTLFAVVPGEAMFAGFASPAWWLVFGGSITGIALRTTGLAQRLCNVVLAMRIGTYRYYVTIMVVGSVALAFVMPSTTGRILLLTPIALTFADRLGLTSGRRGRTGLVLGVAAASYMPPTSILPANIPNSVLMGLAQQLYGIKLSYGTYLLLHFPVLGALKAAALTWVICRLYPDRIDAIPPSGDALPTLSAREIVLITVLVLSMIFYAADFWHGISPAWVSLAAGIICLLPHTKVVSPKEFADHMQITPLLYVAGFLALGSMITASGLGRWAAQMLIDATSMEAGRPVLNASLILAMGTITGFLATLPGLPAVLTPIAGQLAQASGSSLFTVLMLQVPVFSTVFLPYQSPPMMIAMQMGGVSLRDGTRLCLALAAITLLFLLPLDYCWWRLLGALP